MNHQPIHLTFKKHERLKSKKLIERLFESGKAINIPPLKLLWIEVPHELESPVQAGFSVPKRNFPKAVDRNRIKRLMRESWRLKKNELYQSLNDKQLHLSVMFIFIGKQMPDYNTVTSKVITIIQRLESRL